MWNVGTLLAVALLFAPDSHHIMEYIMYADNPQKKTLPKMSLEELNHLLEDVKAEISSRQPTPTDLVEFIPNFCEDNVLMEQLWKECESLNLSCQKNKVGTQWLSPTDDPYIYNDVNPIHKAKDLNDFQAICKLMSFVNLSDAVDGPLDSCLVLKYPSSSAILRPHADDEDIIDQTKSICPFSLGTPRTLEFFTNSSKKPKAVVKHRLENGGMLVMKPGCQQLMNHCVRADTANAPAPSHDGVRYCLSFRALNKNFVGNKMPQPVPLSPLQSLLDDEVIEKPVTTPQPTTPKRHVCLVAGDSFAARLEPERLGRGKVKVENIAVGGSKILDVAKQVVTFLENNENVVVDKIIISAGTNDIRFCTNGVDHLNRPLKKLCYTLENLLPRAKIFFQSLIPLPLKYHYDFNTPRNIHSFNNILFNTCIYKRFYYLDVFHSFLQPKSWDHPQLREEAFFKPNDIHPNSVGLGLLARHYNYALTSKFFNPLVYQ